MYEKKCLICSVNDLLQRDDRMPLGAELYQYALFFG